MRSLKDNLYGVVDLSVVLMVGISFAALMVVAFIIWEVQDQITPNVPSATTSANYNNTYASVQNITSGFDDGVNLLLIAITIFILAIAISALLMLRGR